MFILKLISQFQLIQNIIWTSVQNLGRKITKTSEIVSFLF